VTGARRGLWRVAAIAAIALPASAAMAQVASPALGAAAIVQQGNGRGAPACISCHGPQLQGIAAMAAPRLAGQSAAYVVAQLDAFASGARKNPIMLPVATALSPAERQSLAEYVSGLAAAAAGPAPAPVAGVALGQALATRGRWSSGLPTCDQCHGPGGVGVGSAFPPLAGQPAVYQVNQLHAWQQGTRPPGPLGLMSTIAGKLSEADIQAVSAYYQSRPATVPAARAGRP